MKTIRPLSALIAALAVLILVVPVQGLSKTAAKSSSQSGHKASKSHASAKAGKRGASRGRKSSRSRSRHTSSSRAVVPQPTEGASGTVVDAEGPARTYTVKSGQGLAAVARATDLSVKELATLNGLKEPYHLRPGQKLKLGAGKAKGKGKAYVVARGDTLTAVARRFMVTPQELSTLNHLGKSKALKPGRKLLLPAEFEDRGVIEAETHTAPRVRIGEVHQAPVEPGNPTLPPVQGPTQTVAPLIDPSQVAQAGAGRFQWPLAGRVVQAFGSRSGEKADDGIDIAAAAGTPVKAAAAGTVLFAGKQIAAFGNYVLIQHDGGFFTAYGHMDRLNVKIGQRVAQGEDIGLSGQTGQAAEPQLHFEILYAARREDKSAPIDPQTVLPKR